MLPELESVLRLQNLDRQIVERQKDIAALPKQIAAFDKPLELHQRRLEADRAALSANQKERKQTEGEIQLLQQKVTKLRAQLMEAKNNEQYRAFQSEIEFAEREIRKHEDRVLQLMTESEPLDQAVKAAEASLSQERKQVEIEKNTARDRAAESERFLKQVQAQRKEVASTVKPQLLSLYDRISKKYRGLAVADASEGRCSACMISLRPQFFQDLKQGDSMMTCESCGRILTYNPPVELAMDLVRSGRA